MPDASLHDTILSDALDRANRLRQRAVDCRLTALRIASYNGWSSAQSLFDATMFDSQADIIMEAIKRGKPVPKVDFGNEPFKG